MSRSASGLALPFPEVSDALWESKGSVCSPFLKHKPNTPLPLPFLEDVGPSLVLMSSRVVVLIHGNSQIKS